MALGTRDPKVAIQLFNDLRICSTMDRPLRIAARLLSEAFAEADSEFDRCIKRRGGLGLSWMTYPIQLVPAVYYYQGLARAGLNSPGAADSYRKYLDLRGKNTEDPLVADIRRRVAK
jgi:hypothetical protein